MTVYLVGAGPGDPGLLTRRGAVLLAEADCVVYDRLAAVELLDLAPRAAQRIDVGKAPGRAAMTQEEINDLLVERGGALEVVVRLKGGDPFVFGRGGEEAQALIAAGIDFEVVPGVTSAIAAPAYAGIPVTQRGLSTHVTIVTGHEDPTKSRTDTDWGALARAGGTLVILMGAGRIAAIADELLAAGLSPETPVAAVRWGTHPRQRSVRGVLSQASALEIEPPSAIVVGAVAELDLGWFEARPLFGRRVVVTRAREQASALSSRLRGLGAEVVELPTIEIEPVDFELPDLAALDWIVFTSANGVDRFFEGGIEPAGLDARALGSTRIAVIGPGTAAALARRGLRPDVVPERFVAESLLEALGRAQPGERALVARAEVARDVLPDGLADLGYEVDVLAVYRTIAAEPDPEALELVRSGAVDAVTFTSSSTVTNFCSVVGPIGGDEPTVVSIGPITSKTAVEAGLTVDVEASRHDIDGVVDAVLAHFVRAADPS